MTYRVVLIESEEGFAVGCPALPGCWSQGASREEALANIRDAIREVLEVKFELESAELREDGLRMETVDVDVMAHA
jgi:predicted RNase H-like HicB family nuclease